MKNRYFQKMQRNGINYRKRIAPLPITSTNRIFSEGESLAYKYWAISDRYNASDIFIDVLPEVPHLEEMLETFRAAGIKTVVIAIENENRITDLKKLGCKLVGECKVFRRETMLYHGTLEILKGFRLMLYQN